MRGIRAVVVVGLVAGAVMAISATSAFATSCAPHPDASASSILVGEEVLAIDGGFDAWYRGAVLGTVVDVDTDERPNSASNGATVVRLDVLGTFGDVAGDEARIEMSDPGWMSGYAFQTGVTYFVPVRHEPTSTMACEPITVVADDEVDGLVAQLDPPQEATLLTVGASEVTITPAAAESDGSGDGGGVPGWLWVAVALVVAAGAVGVTALVTRH